MTLSIGNAIRHGIIQGSACDRPLVAILQRALGIEYAVVEEENVRVTSIESFFDRYSRFCRAGLKE